MSGQKHSCIHPSSCQKEIRRTKSGGSYLANWQTELAFNVLVEGASVPHFLLALGKYIFGSLKYLTYAPQNHATIFF